MSRAAPRRRYFSRPFAHFLPPFRNAVVIFSAYLIFDTLYSSRYPKTVPAKSIDVEFPKSGGAFNKTE